MRTPAALTAIPDRRRRPSDGLVVEAKIVARLLGLRLLTLEATVVVVPAEVTAPAHTIDGTPRAPARSDGVPPERAGAAGSLAEAVRRIDEGAAILAEVRAARPRSI
jgi:pyridoxal biosynthesis lyase PdxS